MYGFNVLLEREHNREGIVARSGEHIRIDVALILGENSKVVHQIRNRD